MNKKVLLTFLGTLVIISMVLMSCSSSTTPATSNPTASKTTSATSAAPAEKSITVALSSPLTTLDPAVMGGAGSQAGQFNVFEPIATFDENNKMVFLLADSIDTAADGKSITIKLKDGIKFSSGDPLTSADVKWSLERYAANPGPTAAQLTQNFSGIEIIDDLNFKFVFPEVNVQFLPQTIAGQFFIISKAQYDRVGEDEFVKAPAGTGPYKFVDFKEGQYVDLAYNEYFRGAKPQITSAHIVYTTDPATRASQLQAGEVDMIYDVQPSSVAMLENAGYTRYDVDMPHDICLQFAYMTDDPPWSDVKVRKAISYAIDKDLLNEKLFGGVFKPAVWLMDWELGYDSSLNPDHTYNINTAKSLMAEAGYSNGFEMPIYFPSFMSWAKDMTDYLTGALSELNITVKPMACSDFGAMMGSINKLHNDPSESGVVLFDVGWPGNPESVINLTNGFYKLKDNTLFINDELNGLIETALKTPDNASRAKLVTQAYTIINNEMPFIPIELEVTVVMYTDNITYTPTRGMASMSGSPANIFDLTIK